MCITELRIIWQLLERKCHLTFKICVPMLLISVFRHLIIKLYIRTRVVKRASKTLALGRRGALKLPNTRIFS
jgi:hypothetical protein